MISAVWDRPFRPPPDILRPFTCMDVEWHTTLGSDVYRYHSPPGERGRTTCHKAFFWWERIGEWAKP